jgi:hypothetical protein
MGIITLFFKRYKSKSFKKIKTVFIVTIMVVIAYNSMISYSKGESGSPEENGENSGDWYIEDGDYISRENETIIINGNLIINGSGILELTEVNLKINSTSNKTYGIYVKPGGELYISSSTIESYDNSYSYTFQVEGYMYMKKCTVNDLNGSSNNPNSGIQLYSDSKIIDSTINGSSGTGIYINESKPTICNTKISNCFVGIYFNGPCPSLDISPKKATVISNSSLKFNVSNGEGNYTWSVTNSSIGTINNTGYFLSNNTGTCFIKVSDGENNTGKVEVTVISDDYYNITKLSPAYAKLRIDDKLQINVTNGTQPYNWSVDNSTIGTIDQNGLLTVKSEGFLIIEVSDANNTNNSAIIEIDDKSENEINCLIIGNIYSNNQIGFVINNGSINLTENLFKNNEVGLQINNASPHLSYCDIINNNIYDIQISNESYPTLNFTSYNYSRICADDDDEDSMPNYFENQYGLNQSSDDSNLDLDNDNLSNLEEFQYGTDPLNPDTDSDGMNDYSEIKIFYTNQFSGNEEMILNENLTIGNNQTLILTESKLIINSTSNSQYGIYVEEGGSLYLQSTEINCFDSNYSYYVVVEGNLNMTDCIVLNGGDCKNDTNGIMLYSNASILNSQIKNSSGSGIYINNCCPIIYNNSISECHVGIYVNGSLCFESNISKNSVYDNEIGISINNSSPVIANNSFSKNNISIQFINSNSNIEFCSIQNSNSYDFQIDANSEPTVEFTGYDYLLMSFIDDDSDGIPNWFEEQYGLDPNDPNDANLDTDNDGLTNIQEYQYGTDPNLPDTDGDSLGDNNEIITWNTNPLKYDSDDDVLNDNVEIDESVYWFEAEDNKHQSYGVGLVDTPANDPLPEGDDAARCKKTSEDSNTNGEIIDISIQGLDVPGKYLYYVKARLESGEKSDLKLKYYDVSEHSVTKTIFRNHYKWYKYDSIIELNTPNVNLYAQDLSKTGRIYIDKCVLMKVSDLSFEVTTTNDEDDTIELSDGEEVVTITIPIQGNLKRFVSSASMNILGVSEETGKGLSDQQLTSNNNKWENLPDIAITTGTTNKIHVVYQEEDLSSNIKVCYLSSTSGTSWSSTPSISIPTSKNNGAPSIDASNNDVHVVYASLDVSDSNIYYTNFLDGNSGWSTKKELTSSDYAYEPNIAVDDNNVNVVWYNAFETGINDVYYKKSSTKGRYWEISEQITDTGDDNPYLENPPYRPDVEVDSSNVHIVYDYEPMDPYHYEDGEIMYTKLCNNGETIIDHSQLSNDNDYKSIFKADSSGCIAVDKKNIHVVWVDYDDTHTTDGEIYYRRSIDNGRTWDNEVQISNSVDYDSIDSTIAVDGDNSLLYIFWSEEVEGGNYEIKYRRSSDNGDSWDSITQFTSDDDIDSRAPKIAPDGTGTFHVVWYDDKPLTSPPTHDNVFYNNIENDIPELPTLDVGNDGTIDFSPDEFNTILPIYDFSEQLNEYINSHEWEIENGQIAIPLAFDSDSQDGTFKLMDISIKLCPDISDPNDKDTDADEILDGYEKSNNKGKFNPEYSFKPFESAPSIMQYGSSMVSRIVTGADGIYIHNKNGDEYWHYQDTSTTTIQASPAISDLGNDGGKPEIVVGSVEGKIYCLDGIGKAEKWKFDTSNPPTLVKATYPFIKKGSFYSSPAVGDFDFTKDNKCEIVAVNYQGHVYLFDHDGTVLNVKDLNSWLNRDVEWVEEETHGSLESRRGHAISSNFGHIVLFGGWDGSSSKYQDTWIYDNLQKIWVERNPQGDIPSTRYNHAMSNVYYTDKTVLFGGNDGSLKSDTYQYDLSDNLWTEMIPMIEPPEASLTARQNHAMAAVYGTDETVLFGGDTGSSVTSETWVYNYNSDMWIKQTPTYSPTTATLTARQNHGMAMIWGDDKVVMFGGKDGSNNLLKDTWVYDFGDAKWIKKADGPKALEQHAMTSIWNDDKVILYGGYDGTKRIDDIWIFDLSDNLWTKMIFSKNKIPPIGRQDHAIGSFYDTKKIFVYGGYDGSVDDETWICDFSNIYRTAHTYSSPVLADIDDDDKMDITICDENGKIYCLNEKLNLKWTYDVDSPIRSTPAIGDIDRELVISSNLEYKELELIVGSDDGKIHCINHDGTLRWNYNTYSQVHSSPAIANVDVSSEELEIVVGANNGIVYCFRNSGEIDWQFPYVGSSAKGAFKATPITVDLNSLPDGGYEIISFSENGFIYSIDTVGSVEGDYSLYSQSNSYEYPNSIICPTIIDLDNDKKLEIILGQDSYRKIESEYDCYPNEIKWGTLGAGTHHNGKGDNRYVLLVQGSNDLSHARLRFRQSLQQSYKLYKYTGYYLDDQIYYIADRTDIILGADRRNADIYANTGYNGKSHIIWATDKIKSDCDYYDTFVYIHEAHGGYHNSDSEWWFDANGNDGHNDGNNKDLKSNALKNLLNKINCQRSIVILSGCKSGGFIGNVKKANRIVLTASNGARRSQGDWDLWWYTGTDFFLDSPSEDIDEWDTVYIYDDQTGNNQFNTYIGRQPFKTYTGSTRTISTTLYTFAYKVTYEYFDSDGDRIYGFATVWNGDPDFFEDRSDICSEFIGGIVYALKKKWFDPSITGDNDNSQANGYISIHETFQYSKLWDAANEYEKPQIDTGSALNSKNIYLW